jgi:aminopeptidase
MSSTALIVPVDLQAATSQTIPNLDPVKLWSTGPSDGKTPKVGTTRIFYNTPVKNDAPNVVTLTSLGENFTSAKPDAQRELVRKAVGSAVKSVVGFGDAIKEVSIDASSDPHAAGRLLIETAADFCLNILMSSCCCSLGQVQIYIENRPAVFFQS